jgi:hypothetical protein
MCLLPRGVLRVKYLGADRAIATIDSSGRVLMRTAMPRARALERAPSFANAAFVADGCRGNAVAVTPYFGAWWYSIASNGTAQRFAYREPGREAIVTTKIKRRERIGSTETTQSTMTTDVDAITRGAFQHGDTVIVEAGGTTLLPSQLLDYYVAATGAYIYSRRLPFTPNALAFSADGSLYLASIGNETSAIVRLTTTPISPRDQAKRRPRQ